MSDLKGLIKTGWHPKGKDGGRESWRGDFKGINQVAGWVGKGKSSEIQTAQERVSRPLATLKDPTSFGPPPKNVNYHGGAALPNEITPHRGGLGAPMSQSQIDEANSINAVAIDKEQQPSRPPPPPLPYRADRTGLTTEHLPPPPTHRDLQRSPISPPSTQSTMPAGQPRLPPRLPARQNTNSPPANEPPPPSYDAVAPTPEPNSYLNHSAVNNLGRAGISVPGLGIGAQTEPNPWKSEKSLNQHTNSNQLSELQSRFARMNSQDSTVPATSPAENQSASQTSLPSWKQSQSAFKTAQNLRTNPQSVSLSDAQSAAQTASQAQRSANSFKERHADSIAKGQAKAKAWDQKYKVTSKVNKFLDEHTDPEAAQQQQTPQQPAQNGQQAPHATPATIAPPQVPQHPAQLQPQQSGQSVVPGELTASISRKPPPPPAPRKPANLQAPPPVPVGTKPSFG